MKKSTILTVLPLCVLTGFTLPYQWMKDIPANLAVPKEDKLIFHAYAKGVQIYQCVRDSADTTRFSWTFVGPEATLYTNSTCTHAVGKHYAGPTWETIGGSKVIGIKFQQADSPDPGSIPWLLLKSGSNNDKGIFAQVVYIQRIRTKGGKAPSTGADKAHKGVVIRVPYSAEYLFYK